MTYPTFEVELPAEFETADLASLAPPGGLERRSIVSASGFAEVAVFTASFGSQLAVLVTLFQSPATIRSLADMFARRRGNRGQAYWLQVRGPGGQATIELVETLDSSAIEGLFRAIWAVPDDAAD